MAGWLRVGDTGNTPCLIGWGSSCSDRLFYGLQMPDIAEWNGLLNKTHYSHIHCSSKVDQEALWLCKVTASLLVLMSQSEGWPWCWALTWEADFSYPSPPLQGCRKQSQSLCASSTQHLINHSRNHISIWSSVSFVCLITVVQNEGICNAAKLAFFILQ